jgi:CheY-specific phosphatase CheX
MTPASNQPDLGQIGQRAFTEVLNTLLSLPATVCDPAGQRIAPGAPEQLTSVVRLAGPRVSGGLHLQLPLGFVAHAVKHLTGLDGDSPDAGAVQEDTAAELANMVAGRVAAQMTANGYPCSLGTPSVARHAGLPAGPESGVDCGRTNLICEGHLLSLELHCCYKLP